MAYGNFKDSTRRTASDKILLEKVFDIAQIPKYDRYIVSMVYNFLIKKTSGVSCIKRQKLRGLC